MLRNTFERVAGEIRRLERVSGMSAVEQAQAAGQGGSAGDNDTDGDKVWEPYGLTHLTDVNDGFRPALGPKG